MTTRSTIATALAVLCVVSMGVSATTLESTVRTNPDEVIDLDWERLPIGEEAAAELKAEMRENEGTVTTERPDSGGQEREVAYRSRSDAGGSEREVVTGSRSGTGARESLRVGGEREPVPLSSQQSAGEERESTSSRQPAGGVPPDRSPWDRLWLLAAIALLAAVAAVGYRYVRRLDLVGTTTSDGPEPHQWPPEEPATEVDRAWLAMVGRLDLDRPWTRTPAEVADAAVEAGMDPEGVYRVTAAFEEVHYGGSWIKSSHRKRVREGLERLGVAPEGGRQ